MKYILTFLLAIGQCYAANYQEARHMLDKLIKKGGLSQTKLVVNNDWRVNAEYTGFDYIYVNEGTLRLNDQQIAFILAHELGHKALGHRYSNYANELAADAYGAALTRRAGFNICAGMQVLKTFKGGATHPPGIERYSALRSYCHE